MIAYCRLVVSCRFFWLSLVMHDIRQRYRWSIIGVTWAILQPAVLALIITDSVNELIREHGFSGKVDLLSLDIDRNDYWIGRPLFPALVASIPHPIPRRLRAGQLGHVGVGGSVASHSP